MINQVILSGNVCGDPDVKTFQDGGSIASFSLATTEKGYTTKSGTQVQDRTDFHRIVLKGGLTRTVPYIRKGDKINIVGKLTYRKYNDQSGTERQITEIIAEQVDFCTKHPCCWYSDGSTAAAAVPTARVSATAATRSVPATVPTAARLPTAATTRQRQPSVLNH